MKMHLQVMHLN